VARLTAAQLRALDVLLVEGTLGQAAGAAGVDEERVQSWQLMDRGFQDELSRRRAELSLPRVADMHARSLGILDDVLRHGRTKDRLEATKIVEAIHERTAANDDLTPREMEFVTHYVRDSNGAGAARAAGYAVKGASAQASQLLLRPAIQRAIRAAKAEMAATMTFDEDFVITNLGREAVGADHSSDRISATVHLGRARGMFTDVVVKQAPTLSNEEKARRLQALVDKAEKAVK
jgi:hypothetical protein